MAIDPNIALSAGAGVPPPGNPMLMATQAQALATGAAQNRLTNTNADTAQQGLATKQQQAIAGISVSALSRYDPNNPSSLVDALHSGIDRAVQAGVIPLDQARTFYDGIGKSTDPAHLVSMVRQTALQAIDPNAALGHIYGANTTQTNNQELQPGVTPSPMMGGGFRPAGQPTPIYPSRSELAGRIAGPPGPNGEPTTMPLAGATPLNLAGPAAASSPLGTGRFPSALRNPANAPPAAPQAASNGVVVTGIGPAQQAAASATGTSSASAFQRYADEGVAARSQDAILGNMLADTTQFATGAGQDKIKAFQAALTSRVPAIAAAFGIDPKSVAANESFDKFAAQIASAQGAGSDARLSVAQQGNPSSSLTPQGVDMILRQLRGNAAYIQARQQAAAAYPNKTDSQGFEATVAKNLDPRAFQLDHMTTSQRGEYLNAMSPADQVATKKSYLWAKQNGLMGGGNAGR